MDLNCLNGIITDNLAIHIDLTNEKSWDYNTGFTSVSLTKWKNAVSDNLNLYDFGLTGYDNGRVDRMYSGLTFTPQDTNVTLYRVGYNQCISPYSGDTMYDLYPLSAITTEDVGNYFALSGGYLQGFFKLEKYNFEQFPSRYNYGITIETIINLYSDSSGIFYHMGLRAEDKYNDYFSGETKKTISTQYETVNTGVSGPNAIISETITGWSGVSTSENHYLHEYVEKEVLKNAFGSLDDGLNMEQDWVKVNQSANTKNNIIAFGITDDKRLYYQLIDGNNLIRFNTSSNQLNIISGWTIIAISFTPDGPIANYDPTMPNCYPRRKGTLSFYVNGRLFWKEKDFDEFYFRAIGNDREKQLGVPYNISWGGGSYGLKHSCHYDIDTHNLYSGETTQYILDYFISKLYPFNINPHTGATFGEITFSGDSNTFVDQNNDPITVFRVDYTGTTAQTPSNQYYIEHTEPFEILSNREYNLSVKIYDTGIFNKYDSNNSVTNNSISLIVYGTEDIEIISETKYKNPITPSDNNLAAQNAPYPILSQEYQYYDPISGLLISGPTGYPANVPENQEQINRLAAIGVVTGTNKWNTLNLKFKLKDNSAVQTIFIGLLINSNVNLKNDFTFFINDWKYSGSDALNKDIRKDDLLIQQNFDKSFNGGIQKLRIYDVAFNSQQILHNAIVESQGNSAYNLIIQRGGRIIYR
jgi:hypothetical protein